ncbi:hypothetical protein [Streptomyces chiangmaiensis]|uniref:Uncharacterized protein n=1 Tax=Streptomyces chiangmaiensis TaxID=766497 RepID=A0ABU7FEQ6_9ACTN|nr:hypothetical protein [Streptomyces chiangmaiensis]MED7822584.1 hypothetical protein [Streptomyces chiangmaiensis]
MTDLPAPTTQMVRNVLDECVYAASKTLIRDDRSSDPEALTALAALTQAVAEYKAQTLAVAKFRAQRTKEASK